MLKIKYRIITDEYCGFKAQIKYWYWPFWIELKEKGELSNTHSSIKDAIEFILECKEKKIKPPKFVSKVVWQDPPDSKLRLKTHDTVTTIKDRESL